MRPSATDTVTNAEPHLVDGGHWALETDVDEIVALARNFL
jgi:hypothetical protein